MSHLGLPVALNLLIASRPIAVALARTVTSTNLACCIGCTDVGLVHGIWQLLAVLHSLALLALLAHPPLRSRLLPRASATYLTCWPARCWTNGRRGQHVARRCTAAFSTKVK